MAASTIKTDCKIFSRKDGEVGHFLIEDSASCCFLSVFNSKKGWGAGVLFSPEKTTGVRFEKLLSEIGSLLEAALPECETKVVGHPGPVARAIEGLKKVGIVPVSRAEKTEKQLEVLFYPLTGRVRVAVAAEAEPGTSAESVAGRKLRVLIVDDSDTIRKLLSGIFSKDPELEVIGAVEKPSEAEAIMAQSKTRPDVITLDIHMPEMDGVTFLRKFLPKYPIPTVMISSISMEEGPMVLEALEAGAVDYIQKPSFSALATMAPLMIEKVKIASRARLRTSASRTSAAAATPQPILGKISDKTLVAIGSSTGGTEALREVLTQLPAEIPPIVIVQHIPAVFSLAFANRLNSLCPFEVKEGEDGDEVRPGRVIVAPGGKQMRVKKQRGGKIVIALDDGPPVGRHKPSVDVLFDSVASEIGASAIGIILTGMGADGAKGMLKMRNAGARTIAQDEASCVVFGMPREAIANGAAEIVSPLLNIPRILLGWLIQKAA